MTLLIGTAGHVDHGKSSLIKALTGQNPDRLPIEKQKGLTVELGFAKLNLENNLKLNFIDAPGHKRFIRQMLMCAGTLEAVMFLIAANDSLKEQSYEHLEILNFFNIKHSLIILSKTDLVEKEELLKVKNEIKAFSKNTFLAKAEIFEFSIKTQNEDKKKILHFLTEIAQKKENNFYFKQKRNALGQEKEFLKPKERPFLLMPIDRHFTLTGLGPILTGSILSGKINKNDFLEIYPQKEIIKVKNLENNSENQITIEAVNRAAINYSSKQVDCKNNLKNNFKGSLLASPNIFKPTSILTVNFKYLKTNKKPLKNNTKLKLHLGADYFEVNLRFLSKEMLNPGEEDLAQIFLLNYNTKDPNKALNKTVTWYQQPFILRQLSPPQTIGGGFVIHNLAPKLKKNNNLKFIDFLEFLDFLENLKNCNLKTFVKSYFALFISENLIINLNNLKSFLNLPLKEIEKYFNLNDLIIFDTENNLALFKNDYANLKQSLINFLKKQETIPLNYKNAFKNKTLYNFVSKNLNLKNKILNNTLPAIKTLNSKPIILEEKELLEILNTQSPKNIKVIFSELEKNYKKENLLKSFTTLIEKKEIIALNKDIYFKKEIIDDIWLKCKNILLKEEILNLRNFKNNFPISRKYIIAILEYFDDQKLTLKIGTDRILRKNN